MYQLICYLNVDWKHVDTCKHHLESKACVKNEENAVMNCVGKWEKAESKWGKKKNLEKKIPTIKCKNANHT